MASMSGGGPRLPDGFSLIEEPWSWRGCIVHRATGERKGFDLSGGRDGLMAAFRELDERVNPRPVTPPLEGYYHWLGAEAENVA